MPEVHSHSKTSSMNVRYEIGLNMSLTSKTVLHLFDQAGISKPNWTLERMARSLENSIVACAWHEDELVGFASAITDFVWIGYITQLAVKPTFQNHGIGKHLVEMVSKKLGDEVALLVHSSETATKFYQSAGFEAYSNIFRKKRKK